MADWNGLVAHIKSKYKIKAEGEGWVNLLFETSDLRTQLVQVVRGGEWLGTDWADIRTIVGDASSLSPNEALERNITLKCGFFGVIDGHLWLLHRFPLADLDINEFEVPLEIIVNYGDVLEKELTGKDEH